MGDGNELVGFVGLGNMGVPMATAVAAGGWPVVGYDSSPAARDAAGAIDGVDVVDALEAVTDVDTLIVVLPNSDIVEAVLVGGGVIERMRPGATIIDMGSSEPSRTRQLVETAAARSIAFLDAPVSGGVLAARAATLAIMVGGDAEFVEAKRPLLETMGKVRHVGGPGSGHALKALNNLMSAAHLVVSSEAIIAGKRFGLDPAVVLDVVNASSGRSGSTDLKWPRYILPATYDSGFALRLMVKDAAIALGLIEATGTSSRASSAIVEAWMAAAEALPADADHTEIARWVESLASADVDDG